MIRKKINKGIIAMLLAVSLTGCGAKQTDTVEEYGGTAQSVTVGASEDEAVSSEVKGDAEADPSSFGEGSLVDKLGGAESDLQGDFSAGGISVSINAHASVTDTEQLPSYRIKTIKEEDIKEDEIVNNLLGAGAEKADRALNTDNGDSLELIESMLQLYYHYNQELTEGKNRDMESSSFDMPGWIDNENYYIHVYEGDVDGVTYQLALGYDKQVNLAYMGYFPKNVGDYLGNSNLDTVANYWITGDLNSQENVKNFLAADKLQGNGEREMKDAETFLREKAEIKIPENYMQFGVTGSEDEKEHLFFVSAPALESNGYDSIWNLENIFDVMKCFDNIGSDNYEINGFIADLGRYINNQEVYLPFAVDETGLYSDGRVYITDKGLMGFTYMYNYQFEEKLSDNVPVLNFDSLVPALENGITNSIDPTMFSGKSINIQEAYFMYYPMPSPDDQNECTFIPAWEFFTTDYNTLILMNAMDGSIISIQDMQ